MRDNRAGTTLAFELESSLGETIKAAPDKTIRDDDGRGERDSASQEKIEILGIGRTGDECANSNRGICLAFEVEVFRDNARVPGTAGCGDEAGHKEWEYARKNQLLPALPATQAENGCGFFEIGGDRHSTGDYIEQDVPLRAEQKKNDGTKAESYTQPDQYQENDWEESSRRD